MHASHEQIEDAIKRKTSAAFYKPTKNNSNDVVKGSADGVRYDKVDWDSVLRCDPKWWFNAVKIPRNNHFSPYSMNAMMDKDFRSVYPLFTKWLLADFSYTTLLKIFELSTKYSAKEIGRCMALVEEYTKRSIEYLIPVLEREQAIALAQLKERKDLEAHSKQVLEMLLKIQYETRGPVDWTKIEEQIKEHGFIEDELNKVKLS